MIERVYNNKTGEAAAAPDTGLKKRYWELDFLRGICVILMVIDHFFFSADYILQKAVWPWAKVEFWQGLQKFAEIYWVNYARNIAHYVVIALFFIICGISCTLSHNNALRGLKALAVALLITVATFLADAFFNLGVLIFFGVIHMLGCAMLLYSLFDLIGRLIRRLMAKKNPKLDTAGRWIQWMLPALVGVIGIIVFFAVPMGHFGTAQKGVEIVGSEDDVFFTYPHLYFDLNLPAFSLLPEKLANFLRNFLCIFLTFENFSLGGSDYFPLIPYAFLVLIGSGIGRAIYHTRAKNMLVRLDGGWNKPVCFVGRHALIVYVLHQVAIVAFFFAAGGIYYLST